MSGISYNEKPVVNGSMAASVNSAIMILDDVKYIGIQAIYSGSPNGTLKLQSGIDGTNWNDVDGSTSIITGAGSTMWNFAGMGYTKMRIVYTRSSGSGTLNIQATGKP